MIKHLRRGIGLTLMLFIAALMFNAAIPSFAQGTEATPTATAQTPQPSATPETLQPSPTTQPTTAAQTPQASPTPGTAQPTAAAQTPQPTTAAQTPQASPTVQATQSPSDVSVDGSKIVSPVLKAAVAAYATKQPGVKIEVNISGTSGGFEKLCNGILDVNMAVTPITDSVVAACQAKNINYVELLLGYDALVVAVNKTSPIVCLTGDQLNKLLAPSASNTK